MSTRKKFVGFALGLGLALLGASPALAVTSPDGGSTATAGKLGKFYVADTKCDGHSAYGNWGGTAKHRLKNSSGCGTQVSKKVGTVGAYRACTDIPFGHDSCSDWKS